MSVSSVASATVTVPAGPARGNVDVDPDMGVSHNWTVNTEHGVLVIATATNTTTDANRTIEVMTFAQTRDSGMYSISLWTKDYILAGNLATNGAGTGDEGCIRYSIPQGRVEVVPENCLGIL